MDSKSLISLATTQAYSETEFRVFAEDTFVLQISQECEKLLGLYKAHQSNTCAFVTACNPLGEMVADDVNAESQSQLENELKFRGLHYIPGEGKHPVGDWPGEPSFLVFGLSQEAAKTLGKKYSQNAIVWCDWDAIPQLLLLR